MAKKLKANGKGSTPSPAAASGNAGHNVGVRDDVMRKAFEQMYAIDREIKIETERTIAPLRTDRIEIWKNLKTDLDAKPADLKPLYGLYRRDQEVKELDDEEARKSQDMLRQGFEALQQGETLNFLTVIGDSGAKKTKGAAASAEPVAPEDEKRGAWLIDNARQRGREAYGLNQRMTDNPFSAPKQADERAAWEQGFMAEQTTNAERMGPEADAATA